MELERIGPEDPRFAFLKGTHGWSFPGEFLNVDLMWLSEGKVVAYMVFISEDGIEDFEVAYNYQRRGIGTQIINELKAERPGLWLEGHPASDAAVRFWISVGLLKPHQAG